MTRAIQPENEGARDVFDPPIEVRVGGRTTLAVFVAAWGLLIVSVPLYAAFLLGNLPEVLVMVSNLQVAAAQRRAARVERRGR
ncbi:hypothetical protein [Subtercola boreus]|uniref:Uncharacterized protein n=1 Tax=Subtercola boreus TaxID=120213 RepID=A0A3E0WG93_9MICO|nr:hypothetical protein [Subtercola boreus]RFA23549.1 hypothetical protein B7R24_01325 [Subtercola boreus]RFA23943.1 hypothetical protein B7R23_01325 [Subtercola boreus]RFA29641.1 hypothetical protein B7R25_01320 [Subtercola boreus]